MGCDPQQEESKVNSKAASRGALGGEWGPRRMFLVPVGGAWISQSGRYLAILFAFPHTFRHFSRACHTGQAILHPLYNLPLLSAIPTFPHPCQIMKFSLAVSLLFLAGLSAASPAPKPVPEADVSKREGSMQGKAAW